MVTCVTSKLCCIIQMRKYWCLSEPVMTCYEFGRQAGCDIASILLIGNSQKEPNTTLTSVAKKLTFTF